MLGQARIAVQNNNSIRRTGYWTEEFASLLKKSLSDPHLDRKDESESQAKIASQLSERSASKILFAGTASAMARGGDAYRAGHFSWGGPLIENAIVPC